MMGDVTDESGAESDVGEDMQTVSDEESLSQRRSLKRIQSLWDDIAEIRMAIAHDNMEGEYTVQQRRSAYYESVRNLWICLKPHLARADAELEEKYLLDVDLGSVTIHPPEPLQEPAGGYNTYGLELRAGEQRPEPVTHEFTGFVEYEETDVELGARWTVQLEVDSFNSSNYRRELIQRIQNTEPPTPEMGYNIPERNNPDDIEEPFRIYKTRLLPESVIEEAFHKLVQAIDELGVGLDLGGDDPHGKT